MGDSAARVMDDHACPEHIGGRVIASGASLVLIGRQPAARLGDFALCAVGLPDVVAGGASQVLIGQLPAARVNVDRTVHKGSILPPGERMVQIGGPSFKLPENFDLDGPPDFQNKVIRDLYYLSTLPSGKVLLDRLASCGKTITFEPTDKGNEQRDGIIGGPTIRYNPDRIRQFRDFSGAWSSRPPVGGLAHEMVHALGDVEGTSVSGVDPTVPTQPNIKAEEARTIGVGRWTGTSPTENSIRRDMGLPPRADHFGRAPPPGTPPPADPRPGG